MILLNMSGLVTDYRDHSATQNRLNVGIAAFLKSNMADTGGYSHNKSGFIDPTHVGL